MLDNIKNKYLLQMIFDNLKKRRKLKILKYNKNFMNRLNIKTEDFQQFKLLKDINDKLNIYIEDTEQVKLILNEKKINDKGFDILSKIEFTKLKEIYLSKNKISNLKLLIQYQLEKLDLSDNLISDINIFENDIFSELKELYLNKNKISEIKQLENAKFDKLIILDLSGNMFSDFNNLKNFKN